MTEPSRPRDPSPPTLAPSAAARSGAAESSAPSASSSATPAANTSADAPPAAAHASASSAAASSESAAAAPSASTPSAPSLSSPELLIHFFSVSAAGKIAAASLKRPAEVAVRFTDAPGDFRFTVEEGQPRLLAAKAKDPDFELTFGPAATRALAARPDADIGDLGVLFFQHMLAADAEAKIRVKLYSGLMKLTLRGYLGVLAAGGPKVFGWLANKGLKGPGAVSSALSRLRKG